LQLSGKKKKGTGSRKKKKRDWFTVFLREEKGERKTVFAGGFEGEGRERWLSAFCFYEGKKRKDQRPASKKGEKSASFQGGSMGFSFPAEKRGSYF